MQTVAYLRMTLLSGKLVRPPRPLRLGYPLQSKRDGPTPKVSDLDPRQPGTATLILPRTLLVQVFVERPAMIKRGTP